MRHLAPFLIDHVKFEPNVVGQVNTNIEQTDGMIEAPYTGQEVVHLSVQFRKELIELASRKYAATAKAAVQAELDATYEGEAQGEGEGEADETGAITEKP